LYEYLENKEEGDEDPPSIKDEVMSQNNNINQNGMPTTMDCQKDMPTNTNYEEGHPSILEDDLLTLSNFMMTSLLRKREDQITRLKNDMHELKTLEKVIKSENESMRPHSIKI
jgi:hypothetical protein